MYNKKPIIIYALSRGGSNLLMNLLLSHPDVCVSAGETHKVFKGTAWDSTLDKVKKQVCYDLPIRLLSGQDVMNGRVYDERTDVNRVVEYLIDRNLYYSRFAATQDTHNKYKDIHSRYTKAELKNCRLLTKGVDGIVFTVDIFKRMYPDATFLALTRHGLAVCEGHVRRGASVEGVARRYRKIVKKMLNEAKLSDNFHMLRYEDMVERPYEFLRKVYEYSSLDLSSVQKIRLQSKKIMDRNGVRVLTQGVAERELKWYDPASIAAEIRVDANENQIRQLKTEEKEVFMAVAGDVMDILGYKDLTM